MTYYTYLWLRDDGTPYYVGKGKGDRAFRKGSPPVDRIILQEWPSEEDAFAAERFLIAFYGRKDNGTGILRNLSDGGEGPGGVIFTPQWRAKLSAKKRGVRRVQNTVPVSVTPCRVTGFLPLLVQRCQRQCAERNGPLRTEQRYLVPTGVTDTARKPLPRCEPPGCLGSSDALLFS